MIVSVRYPVALLLTLASVCCVKGLPACGQQPINGQAIDGKGGGLQPLDELRRQIGGEEDGELRLRDLLEQGSDSPREAENTSRTLEDLLNNEKQLQAAENRRKGQAPKTQTQDSSADSVASSRNDSPTDPDAKWEDSLAALRKPINSIRISDGLTDLERPENYAAMLQADETPRLISDSGTLLPIYSRRTVPFCHRPLYFEQPNLERCGNGLGCLQNPVSAAHFLGSLLALPYQITQECPGDPVPATGTCRCGQFFAGDISLEGLGIKPCSSLNDRR